MAGLSSGHPPQRSRAWMGRVHDGAWLALAVAVLAGCEVRLRPITHQVEYRSDVACVAPPAACPWDELEAQAEFAALVSCLLDGTTVLLLNGAQTSQQVVAPVVPRYGYAHRRRPDAEGLCPVRGGQERDGGMVRCRVLSERTDRVTWAGCEARPGEGEPLRGGQSFGDADELAGTSVVTGHLATARNAFPPPAGLEGPDHFYAFLLAAASRVEVAVAANASSWSPTAGHRSPWQPGLYLLDATGRVLDEGLVWRGGVAYLVPRRLAPGRYVVVVDSTPSELERGDGVYRLYLGIGRNHLGPLPGPP